ncbi:MAG: hypothetical protein JOZ77_05255 [Candidatus Eremiobacteraeota bacterium]|nr:hypothetical protein [Candidatus Eremiobacteraeota bacterium]
MRNTARSIAAFAGGVAVLGACSSNGLSSTPAMDAASASHRQLAARLAGGSLKELAVVYDDDGTVIGVLNDKYKKVMSIADSGAYRVWIDSAGNFYSTIYTGGKSYAQEFDKTGKLLYTYSSSDIIVATDVTTDSKGNVVVASGQPSDTDDVVEFPQGSNKPSVICSTGLVNSGVAFDNSGNLFVTGQEGGNGVIQEYKRGLSGCSGTALAVTVNYPQGIKVDKAGNLVVCDASSGVDIIPPPYKSISKKVTNKGQKDYNYAAVDQKSETLFTVDTGGSKLYVNAYPSGTLETTLGMRNVSGVATYPFQK